MLGCVLMCSTVLVTNAEETVTPSKKAYTVDLYNAGEFFLSNKKEVNVSKGQEVYMTYTVETIETNSIQQQGFIATTDREQLYPYDGCGVMQFDYTSVMLKPGYTYFLKMEITEFGFEYAVAYSNGQDEDYVVFNRSAGKLQDDTKYCGAWFATGTVTGKLTNVRCYDKKGNDLGVAASKGRGVTVYDATKMKAKSNIEHSYSFELQDATHVAISNKKPTKANVVYMEYTIKDATNNFSQTGVEMTNSPTATVPHAGNAAFLRYNHILDGSGSILALSGAKYLIRFERTEGGFDALVQYTLDGKTRFTSFGKEYGSYDPNYRYFTLWFGEGSDCKMSAKFENFKCYDEKGNNLAVQLNQKKIDIVHYGGLEDYSPCEAAYYCATNDTMITLSAKQDVVIKSGAEKSNSGTYRIDGQTLTMKMGKQDAKYEYAYVHMIDENGNKFLRLKEYQVKFVTGKETVSETASMENGYQITKPEEPTLKNNEFKGWYLGDGTEYEFGNFITESITLYAKWVDGDGNEYLATDGDILTPKMDLTPVVVISICTLIVAATVCGMVLIMKRGKKNETDK